VADHQADNAGGDLGDQRGPRPGSTEHTQVLRTSVAVQERLSASREQGQQSPSSLPPPFFKTDCSSGSSALASSVNVTARVETGLEPAVAGVLHADDAGEEAFGLAQDQRLAQGALGPELGMQSLPAHPYRVGDGAHPYSGPASRTKRELPRGVQHRVPQALAPARGCPRLWSHLTIPATTDDNLGRMTSRGDSCGQLSDGAGAP